MFAGSKSRHLDRDLSALTNIDPHNDRTDTPATTAIYALFFLFFLGAGTRAVPDGLACFHGVTAAGCVHEPVVVGCGKARCRAP